VSIPDKSMCSHSRDPFFSRVSLLIDRSFLYHLSFIPFQMRFGLFLIRFPAFLEGFFLLANHRSLNVIQVILTQYFCLFRRFETSNLCACMRTGNARCMISDLCLSFYINMYVAYDNNTTMTVPDPIPHSDPYIWKSKARALPVSRRRPWWSDGDG
jgi:hypothetical protein